MAARLAHRGPDGEGEWMPEQPGPPLALVHRRLAIRGAGADGAQPAVGRRGVLAFNGELFGLDDLRLQIAAKGERISGRSDTEVLLRALDTWGMPDVLSRVRGQFAFVWWCSAEQKLYLVRDRVGVRPLYFSVLGPRLAVASEQKALLQLPWIERRFSASGMFRFLTMGRTDDVPFKTLIEGIESMPAGHFAAWDGVTLDVKRYHRFELEAAQTTATDIRRELRRAVAEQLVSDVPIGVTISGGLDSSAIVAVADDIRQQEGSERPLHVFAFHDALAQADERPYQDAVISALKSSHVVHWVSSSACQLVDDFDRYVDSQEEPFADVSSYGESRLAAAAAANGVRVLLNGIGGDEVFLGYPGFCAPLFVDLVRGGHFGALRDLVTVWPQVVGGPEGSGSLVARSAHQLLPSRIRNAVGLIRHASGLELPLRMTTAGLRESCTPTRQRQVGDWSGAMMLEALESWATPRFLQHSDRMCLASGVESRVPLLDEGVIRAALAIPPCQRVGSLGLKHLLRIAVGDLLPPLVAARRWKLGFHLPLTPYVHALEEPLRAGHQVLLQELGGGPDWAALGPAARWRFGTLGAYLGWARAQGR